MYADLHLHTNFSDGTYTPEELAGHAARCGFKAVALTDHDTMEGCERMGAACVARSVEFIPATELTAELGGHELHMLGYFLDPQHARLQEELARFQEVRQNRIVEMVVRLNALGIPLKHEAVFQLANCRSPGRPHVARTLVQGGWCSSLDEAFERFLRKGRPAWVPKFKISATDAIALVHQAGGLAVLAHPGLNHNDDLIPELVEAGMDGIECFHTKHSTTMTQRYLEMADHLRLLVTGGSDCHGMSKGKPLIGSIKVPYDCVLRLRERAFQRAADRGVMLASVPVENPKS
ncbi:MAG: 3,5-nucleoside bisphosphate phosphatase [Verrucomicrobiota bacterium]|jgi:predicted metal-dependent phosphoesterase TrpH